MNDYISIRKQLIEREFKRMNAMQKQAVFHTEGPLLILAGAGSGKTTVLVNRIANIIKYGCAYASDVCPSFVTGGDVKVLEKLLESGGIADNETARMLAVGSAKPWEILAITFTNKAAGELKNRLKAMLGDNGNDVWASTFHSMCSRVLRRDADRLGYTGSLTIYDTDDSQRLIKECQKQLNVDDKLFPYKMVLSEISKAKNGFISEKEYVDSVKDNFRLKTVGQLFVHYQKRLRDANAMDFDDLLVKTVELFEQNKDILEYYQNRFKYVMVDEYQDTNRVQYLLIRLLAGQRKNLCVVGDDDQSIYKFRGATIENILSFEKHYKDARVIRLEQNYRSTQTILDAANAVISNNKGRKGKTLWTDNEQGENVCRHTASDEQDEAGYIADAVLSHAKGGAKFGDHAVLYRLNAQSNSIERLFARSGIPYRIIGGHRFYDRKEIKDVIAYLSVLNNKNDNIRLRRIINEPKRGIGDTTINNAADIANSLGLSVYDVIREAQQYAGLERAAGKLKGFTDIIEELSVISETVSLHELYGHLLEKTGYMQFLRMQGDEGETRIENINELSSNIQKYEEDNPETASLSGFLEEVSLMTELDNYDEEADTVILMTMHSAKGLEFPYVFLPGAEEGIFPGYQTMYDPEQVEEERRLAYVALTRAKKQLYILNSEYRMLFGSSMRNRLSRFIEEIPDELVTHTQTNSYKPAASLDSYTKKSGTPVSVPSFSVGAKKPVPSETYGAGETVIHNVFGSGLVISAQPMGNDTLLEIAFDKVGTKKIMANFAKLEKA